MPKRSLRIGLIAEEDNDVDSAKAIIQRIVNNQHMAVRKFVGHGCGKLRRKCHAWSGQLKQRGCSLLIIIHDLDNRNLESLIEELQAALKPCPIKRHLLCIPVQELEAWLLSDPVAIKTAMHLDNIPNIKGLPEMINSPKEYLGELIYKASGGEKIYINTKHNSKIAAEVSLEMARSKCPSFVPFYRL